MKEEHQVQLVKVWEEANLELTFNAWKYDMEHNYRRVLIEKLPELAKNISIDSGLFKQLQSKKVFDRRVVETFEQKQGKYAQISAALNNLSNKTFENFLGFCECLVETHQIHIIRDYLTPIGLGVRTVQAQLVEDQGAGVGSSIVCAPSDERIVTVLPRKFVDFEWRNSIKVCFPSLANEIDPDGGLIDQLVDRGVISSTTVDVYTSIKGRSNRVEAILNHLRVSRPDEDFIEFCESLSATNQRHIVQRYLTKDSVHHEGSATRSFDDPVPKHDPILRQRISRLVHHLDKDDGWKTVLMNRRSQIIDYINVSDSLMNKLRNFGVINQTTAERFQDEPDAGKRAEQLVDYMYRRTLEDFALLCEALYETGQINLVESVLLQPDYVSVSDGL